MSGGPWLDGPGTLRSRELEAGTGEVGRSRGGTARAIARPGEQPDSQEGGKARREGIEGIEQAGLPCAPSAMASPAELACKQASE